MGKFTASKSLLEKYFSGCAHRAYLYKRWNLKKEYMPKPMKFGIEVHDLIERGLNGEQFYDPKANKLTFKGDARALDRTERAINWAEKAGLDILALEAKHYAHLTDDIALFGVIDCIALDKDQNPVLIDWKTSKSNWTITKNEEGEEVYIGACGWQGPVYLTVPAESSIIRPSAWPTTMKYIVIPEYGTVGEYTYEKNEADDQALIQACQAVQHAFDTGNLPKNRGTWTCNKCDFKHVCWKTKNWTKYYDKRKVYKK